MQFRKLGHSGLVVSRLCLGTMQFGLQTDEESSVAILDRAAQAGVNFLDTADVYPYGGDFSTVGRTEELLGRWLKGRRHDFVIASKTGARIGPAPWDQGASRKHILDSAEASLRRLGTDYIDLFQIHMDDPDTPLDETVAALDQLVRDGKVRYIGLSNYVAWRVAKALGIADARLLTRVVSIQPRYNLLYRVPERALFPLALEEGLGVLPYNPLGGGLLTAKHRLDEAPDAEGRFAWSKTAQRYRDRYWTPAHFAAVDAVQDIIREAGAPPLPTVAVAWVLANPAVTSTIIGASKPDQLDASLAAGDLDLDADLVGRLSAATAEFRKGDVLR
jgi:aryl-alcohol dehydrogenase-like predicted oxidoreductase